MAKNYYDITLALAGICQSARLVQQLAHQGHCDADALHVSLNSVIDLNPGSTLGVFGGSNGIGGATYNGDPALVAGGVSARGIQGLGSVSLVVPSMGIIGEHSAGLVGADPEGLHHQFVTAGFPLIEHIQRVRHIGFFPGLAFGCGVWPCSFTERNATANHERLVVAAHAIGGGYGGCHLDGADIACILAMVLENGGTLIQNARRVPSFCPEGGGFVMGHIHARAALVI